MANKQHAQFSDENGNLFYLESETEDVLDPSGKPLSDGGDLSEASVKFSVDTSRKLPQSGGRFKAFLGSIVKYLTDLGAAAYLAVANNDTTTQPGFVGDARVLKQHRDAINQLSSEIDNIYDTVQTEITNDVAGGSYIAQEDFLMQINLYCNISDSAVDCAVQVNGILRSNLQATNPMFNMLKTDTIKIFKGDKITSTQTNTGAVRLFKYNK